MISAPQTPRTGKILKVRPGYNANSSSIAAMVSYLMLGSAAVVSLVSLIGAHLLSRPEKPDAPQAPPS